MKKNLNVEHEFAWGKLIKKNKFNYIIRKLGGIFFFFKESYQFSLWNIAKVQSLKRKKKYDSTPYWF